MKHLLVSHRITETSNDATLWHHIFASNIWFWSRPLHHRWIGSCPPFPWRTTELNAERPSDWSPQDLPVNEGYHLNELRGGVFWVHKNSISVALQTNILMCRPFLGHLLLLSKGRPTRFLTVRLKYRNGQLRWTMASSFWRIVWWCCTESSWRQHLETIGFVWWFIEASYGLFMVYFWILFTKIWTINGQWPIWFQVLTTAVVSSWMWLLAAESNALLMLLRCCCTAVVKNQLHNNHLIWWNYDKATSTDLLKSDEIRYLSLKLLGLMYCSEADRAFLSQIYSAVSKTLQAATRTLEKRWTKMFGQLQKSCFNGQATGHSTISFSHF